VSPATTTLTTVSIIILFPRFCESEFSVFFSGRSYRGRHRHEAILYLFILFIQFISPQLERVKTISTK